MVELPGAKIEHRGRQYCTREAPLSEAPAGAPRPMIRRVPDKARNLFDWTGAEPVVRQPLPDHAVVWHLWVWEQPAGSDGAWRYLDNFMTKRALHAWIDTQR